MAIPLTFKEAAVSETEWLIEIAVSRLPTATAFSKTERQFLAMAAFQGIVRARSMIVATITTAQPLEVAVC